MNDKDQKLIGGAFAFAAFGSWGVLPIYFKAVAHVPALQILSHRVVWSVVLLAILVTVLRRWPAIRAALRDRRTLLMLGGSTLFICANWLTFIWAVQVERVMEISLGYYINPLVNVLLGVLVLRERLNAAQGAAVALAAVGVANLAVQTTGVPWPSLVLAFSFGIYGLIRKTTALGSIDGLFLETTLMAPVALGYLIFAGYAGFGAFGTMGAGTDLLLIAAGAITALPLIWFASGARRITYIAIGFFQYLAPSGHFLLAVFVFGEPFTTAHLITFGCIWAGLVVFSADTWRRAIHSRRARAAAAAE
ncbi:EamA family transporter RarD [Ferruginivarius sediminum]|uniref:EamA family transporter RarD n=1 Tax=Ferruginivarius sediminum TaxID=2661937 RepID=A0A369TCF7_9PROT|nr:EamA family transporter RarD [Ferruginivarius sediminum]RDD63031.1 EamA family transporter RarD [Ferruginivarius sediminum]